MVGPPDWVTVVGVGRVCEQVAPLHAVPLKVTVPAHVRATGATGVSEVTAVVPRFFGAYANGDVEHAAGMPGLVSWHWKPSAAPVPVQLDPQDASFRPAAITHLPLVHWLSLVQ
jgi:hypothetical protein